MLLLLLTLLLLLPPLPPATVNTAGSVGKRGIHALVKHCFKHLLGIDHIWEGDGLQLIPKECGCYSCIVQARRCGISSDAVHKGAVAYP